MPDAIARLNAALEGRYAIERELGEGSMATRKLSSVGSTGKKEARMSRSRLATIVFWGVSLVVIALPVQAQETTQGVETPFLYLYPHETIFGVGFSGQ